MTNFLGEAEVLLAASGVSCSDRTSVMLSSPAGTGDPGSAVVVGVDLSLSFQTLRNQSKKIMSF